MPRHIWSVLCRKALVDKDTGTTTLLEVVEGINIAGEPPPIGTAFKFPVELITLWMRSEIDFAEEPQACRAVLSGPTSGIHTTPESTIDLAVSPRFRWTLRIGGIPYFGVGVYEFEVQRRAPGGDWLTDARIPLHVVRVNVEENAPSNATP